MAGLNIANLEDGLIFQAVLAGVDNTMNNRARARKLFGQTKKWAGDYLTWSVHTKRGNSWGASTDGGAFSTPNSQTHVQARADRRFLQGSIQLTDGSMATAPGSGPSVSLGALKSETSGFMRDIMKGENYFLVSQNSDGTGKVCDIEETGTTDVKVNDARALWIGTEYDEYNGATYVQTVQVTDIDAALDGSSAQITVSSEITSGNDLYWKDSKGLMPMGLKGLVSSGETTFQNVTLEGTEYYSLVNGNSGTNRPIEPTLLRQVLAGLLNRTGNDDKGSGLVSLANPNLCIEFEEMYEGEMRMRPSDSKSGFAVQAFSSSLGRIDLVHDTDSAYNTMYFADPSQITRAVQQPLQWRKYAGSYLRPSDVSAVHRATAIEICQFIIRERFSSARLDDLSESRLSVR